MRKNGRGVRQSSTARRNASRGKQQSVFPSGGGGGSRSWRAIARRAIVRAGGECQARDENGERFWGCEIKAFAAHHIVDRVDGGTDDDDNLMAVCEPCHERFTVAGNQRRAKQRKAEAEEARRKNHPGRKDRYE
ncbi:HNH endonuclease [Mycobacterium kansasii]|uniref:HNH endonuclease n=1 Tax=Mycobacterium kansasii TaxID=1768 RepID=UPI0009BF2892|nr:hypothetical protein B1T51_16410 [Mycobacterium kansasii]ARG81320.1 hypothetical protein B1T52_16870 [Mycobacterium kansasii]ARG93409.1 hypothetical protein B1T50_17280 [Mycobacterium kansasii]